MATPKVKSLGILCVYAKDFKESLKFYTEVVGLGEHKMMGENSCYFQLEQEQGVYLIGGNSPREFEKGQCMTTTALEVESVKAVFDSLKAGGYKVIPDEPMAMNEDIYWIQAVDPSNLVIEFIGRL